MKVLTAEQTREVDRRTIEDGVAGIALMENAAHRVVEAPAVVRTSDSVPVITSTAPVPSFSANNPWLIIFCTWNVLVAGMKRSKAKA